MAGELIRRVKARWRGRVSLWWFAGGYVVAVTMLYMPGADWRRGAGVAHQIGWEYARARVALYGLLVALVFCLFGRPRLILPIAVACIGTGLFWLFSTIPSGLK